MFERAHLRDDVPKRRRQRRLLGFGACGAAALLVGAVAWGRSSRATPSTAAERCAARKHRLLVTGFEQFGHGDAVTENPSKLAALALNGTCGAAYCAEVVILTVDGDGIQKLSESKLAGVSGVLHLGLENVAAGLRVEIAAKNIKAQATPPRGVDVRCADAAPAVAGAPCLQATTAPLDRVIIHSHLVDIRWSRDPGAFYCNEAYFHTLNTIRSKGLTVPRLEQEGCTAFYHPLHLTQPQLIPALFVHLPNATTTPERLYLPILRQLLDVLGDPELVGVNRPIEDLGRRRLRQQQQKQHQQQRRRRRRRRRP